MTNTKFILLSATAALILAACTSQKQQYARGLSHAQNPEPSAVYNNLVVLSKDNQKLTWKTIEGKQYVLAATWKSDTGFYTTKYDVALGCYRYNTGTHPIWISLAPQLQDMHLGHLNDEKLELRLQQVLGLPYTAQYKYFLEIWVDPADVFRPCFNPATGTNSCTYMATPADSKNTDYMCWLYQYMYGSYNDSTITGRYPFTHLGYTYDWSPKNKSHVGLSEFVIGENKNIFIKKVYTTRQYIGN